ncbi:hypothetical protein SPRG_03895 [Saprolegnia parasitica CBS 223.65]|uniref:Uncharacterized protein n=1 Tax=Saprolegnia parasitica (strain CBS 223.65) TaxID=695850 RepID=A0A067CPX0_SAPPC|nr:hypothetical protein SPRG_03895 [Saprolegnia parasitica CBS 223.65]KDO31280.1 hypothetical protein SPRG_03895 [Saprolegnia parasitica CBS 223.65]|eukprot:XP_012197879.1 hypothetical protein SPRG_03895 [Saprolegnia parasitica CBS 223.65]
MRLLGSDLGFNQLATMPDLSKLGKLAILKLQNNALTSLGTFPSNVTTILAGSNKLASFPTNLPSSVQAMYIMLLVFFC